MVAMFFSVDKSPFDFLTSLSHVPVSWEVTAWPQVKYFNIHRLAEVPSVTNAKSLNAEGISKYILNYLKSLHAQVVLLQEKHSLLIMSTKITKRLVG